MWPWEQAKEVTSRSAVRFRWNWYEEILESPRTQSLSLLSCGSDVFCQWQIATCRAWIFPVPLLSPRSIKYQAHV